MLLSVVDAIQDQGILLDIAKNSDCAAIRKKAVRKIKNECVLCDIAKNDLEYSVGLLAVDGVNNENLLYDIAMNARYLFVIIEAVKKITDQDYLLEIAVNYSFDSRWDRIGVLAVSGIDNEDRLLDIFYIAPDCSATKIAAFKKLSNLKFLYCVAKNDPDVLKAKNAVAKICDEKMLLDLAKNAKFWTTREMAIEKLY